jgi:hypothetical protein
LLLFMSLVQHVTQQEGTDREEALVDLFLSPIDRLESREQASERRLSLLSQQSNAGFLQAGKSVRRVISYDTLHKPDQPVAGDVDGGVTQYHVSNFKRAGKCSHGLCHTITY